MLEYLKYRGDFVPMQVQADSSAIVEIEDGFLCHLKRAQVEQLLAPTSEQKKRLESPKNNRLPLHYPRLASLNGKSVND